jgi:Succinylglutamate desuccinylase / Aspartoacylase family
MSQMSQMNWMSATTMTPLPQPVRSYETLAARIRSAAQRAVRPPLSLRVIGYQPAPASSASRAAPSGTPSGTQSYELYLVRIPARGRPRLRVYLNGGTHGDEPAGAEAVTRFLEGEHYRAWPDVAFTVTPCLNPWGYAHDRREGPGGRDLNRAFRRAGPATPEVGAVKRALRRQAFHLFVDCHEDVDAPGLYVFAPSALGREIVEAVRAVGPVHPGPLVDGEIPLKDSVVQLDDSGRFRERRRVFTTWPLPFYVGRYHRLLPPPPPGVLDGATPATVTAPGAPSRSAGTGGESDNLEAPDLWLMATATVETPVVLPLEQRVTMHLTAIDAALRFISEQR